MDRRTHNRWPQNGAASALRLAGKRFGDIYNLRMLDCGEQGMGAISAEPIEPGTILSLGFEPTGYTARRGMVITCAPSDDAYRVAIRFQGTLAA